MFWPYKLPQMASQKQQTRPSSSGTVCSSCTSDYNGVQPKAVLTNEEIQSFLFAKSKITVTCKARRTIESEQTKAKEKIRKNTRVREHNTTWSPE